MYLRVTNKKNALAITKAFYVQVFHFQIEVKHNVNIHAKLLAGIHAVGGRVDVKGDTGEFTIITIYGVIERSYVITGKEIAIAIIHKPRQIACNKIHSELAKLLQITSVTLLDFV